MIVSESWSKDKAAQMKGLWTPWRTEYICGTQTVADTLSNTARKLRDAWQQLYGSSGA